MWKRNVGLVVLFYWNRSGFWDRLWHYLPSPLCLSNNRIASSLSLPQKKSTLRRAPPNRSQKFGEENTILGYTQDMWPVKNKSEFTRMGSKNPWFIFYKYEIQKLQKFQKIFINIPKSIYTNSKNYYIKSDCTIYQINKYEKIHIQKMQLKLFLIYIYIGLYENQAYAKFVNFVSKQRIWVFIKPILDRSEWNYDDKMIAAIHTMNIQWIF